MPLSVMTREITKIALGPSRLPPAVMSRQRHALTGKNPRSMETLNSKLPKSPLCGRSAADYSLRFLPTDGQIGMYSSPLQRQRCMSAKSTSITQAAPQRRELPRQSAHAVVRKSAHQLRTLVAAGIDSRAHLTRVLGQHCAHGGADGPRRVNLKLVAPCNFVLHQPMHTVRQQPA